MFRHSWAYIAVALLSAQRADAQGSLSDTTYSLPEITIVDERGPFFGNDAAAHITRIDGTSLESSAGRTVGEVLGSLSGVFVRQYGEGGSAGVTLRGTGTGQTAVLLDGVPLENPQLGQIDLSLVPTFMLSGVEVLHGGASSLVGGGAIGGAISLHSTGADEREGVRLATSLGPWGERRMTGRVTGGTDRLRAVVAAEAFSRDGDFPYTDRTRLPVARRLRENADGAAYNMFGRLVLVGARSTTEVAGWFTDAERGLPGLSGNGPSGERQNDRIGRVWLRYGRGGATIHASSQWSRLTYVNPRLGVQDTGRAFTAMLGAIRSGSVSSVIRSTVGLEVNAQVAAHPALVTDRDQYGVRAFALGRLDLGRFRVLPSLRGDWIARSDHSSRRLSPALRLRLEQPLRLPLAIKSGVSSSFRSPTFNDLFWRGQGAAGNDQLRAEKGLSADLGAEVGTRTLSADVSAFYQSVRDQITWQPDERGLWAPENIGKVRTIGLEVSARSHRRIGPHATATLGLHYTITDARDRTDRSSGSFNEPLRHTPMHLFGLDFSTAIRSTVIGATVRQTGRRYVTTDASEWLEPYTTVDTHIRTRVAADFGAVEVALLVRNLGGSEFESMSGYPMPPRHARLQITLTLE